MRHLLLLILIICNNGYFSQNNCETQKSNLESSKIESKKYNTLTYPAKNEYLVHQLDKAKEYLACLKNNGDTNEYDFAWINKEIAWYYYDQIKLLNKDNQHDNEKVFTYFFSSTKCFDNLLKTNKLDSIQKQDARKLYTNIYKILKKIPNPNSEKFAKSLIELFLNNNDLFKSLKNSKKEFYYYVVNYFKNFRYNGDYINKKSLDKNLKRIYSNKDDYLEKEKFNIYRRAGYYIRKYPNGLITKDDSIIHWKVVEELYEKNLKNYEELFDKKKIDSSDLAYQYYSSGIMYMYKNKELKTDSKDFEVCLNKARKIDSSNYNLKSIKSIAKEYYLMAEDLEQKKYYNDAINYWIKAESILKLTKGEFDLEYIQIIKYLRMAFSKKEDFHKVEFYDKILLKITANLNTLNFKVSSIASSKDGNFVVIGCDDGKFKFWNREKEKSSKFHLQTFVHNEGIPIEKVWISPLNNSNSFITMGKYELKLWDYEGNFISKLKLNNEFNYSNLEIFDKNKKLIKVDNNFYDYNFKNIFENNPRFKPYKSDYKFIYDKKTKSSVLYDNLSEKNYKFSKERSTVKPSFSEDEVKDNYLAFSVDLNGQVNAWNFKYTEPHFSKIDSCNLRRQPKMYFISISKDSNDLKSAKSFSNKLKKEILNQYKKYSIIDYASTFFTVEVNRAKEFELFHDSIGRRIFNNDYVIYHYSGIENDKLIRFNSDSSTISNNTFYNQSEKLNADNKLFFIDSDKSFSSLLRNKIDETAKEPGSSKNNLIIISESNGKYLTESYLNSDTIKIMDLFNDHKERTECLHQLYDYSNTDNKDYLLKSYFQKDGFELKFEDQKFDLTENKSIGNGQIISFLVGIDDYNYLSPLNNPTIDIEKIENTLNNKLSKIVDVKKYNDLNYLEFLNKLDAFLNKYEYREGSQLLFYFAGHGTYMDGDSYILFKDTPEDFSNNCITVRRLLNKIKIKIDNKGLTKALIVIDACNQGNSNLEKVNEPAIEKYSTEQIKTFISQKSQILITSTSPEELAKDGIKNKNSPFCKAFVNSIESNYDKKVFTNHELFKSLKNFALNNGGNKTIRHSKINVGNNAHVTPRFLFYGK